MKLESTSSMRSTEALINEKRLQSACTTCSRYAVSKLSVSSRRRLLPAIKLISQNRRLKKTPPRLERNAVLIGASTFPSLSTISPGGPPSTSNSSLRTCRFVARPMNVPSSPMVMNTPGALPINSLRPPIFTRHFPIRKSSTPLSSPDAME